MVLVPPPIDPGQLTQCRRFEVPTPPAANSVRNFKSKSGTGIIELLVPLLFPKFVSERAEVYHELRKRGTSFGQPPMTVRHSIAYDIIFFIALLSTALAHGAAL